MAVFAYLTGLTNRKSQIVNHKSKIENPKSKILMVFPMAAEAQNLSREMAHAYLTGITAPKNTQGVYPLAPGATQYDIRNTTYAIRYQLYAIHNTRYAIRHTQYDIRNTLSVIRYPLYDIRNTNKICKTNPICEIPK